MAATPEELADATAKQAFALCDTNRDGRLDYREFRRWYLAQNGEQDSVVEAQDAIAALQNRLRGLDPSRCSGSSARTRTAKGG